MLHNITAAHGRFSRIRQVAPVCTPSASASCMFCPLLSHFFEYIDHRLLLTSAVHHFYIKFLSVAPSTE